MSRFLAPLATLWLLLALGGGVAAAGEAKPLSIEGKVEGIGWQGHPWWVVATATVADHYRATPLATQRLEGEGSFSMQVADPPERLWLWLVEDRDADGPEPSDPHTPYSLTPIELNGRDQIEITLSGAGKTFEDPHDPQGWFAAQTDPHAGGVVMAVFLAGLALLGLTAWRQSREPAGAPALSRRAHRRLWPQGREALALSCILAVAALLRVAAALARGPDPMGMSELPYLAYALPSPETRSLLAMARDPFYMMSRHPLGFIALLRGLLLVLPAQAQILQISIGVLGLGSVWAAWGITRLSGRAGPALMAAGLVACAPMAVQFGADLSPHGLHLLMVALALLFLARGVLLDHGPSRGLWALFSGLGVLVFPAHGAYLASQLVTLLLLAWVPGGSLRRPAARALGWSLLPVALTAPPQLLMVSWTWRLAKADGHKVGLLGFERLPTADNLAQTADLMSGLHPGLALAAPLALALMVWGLWMLWQRSRHLAVILLGTIAGFLVVDLGWLAVDLLLIDGIRWYTGHWSVGLLAVLPCLLALALARLLGAASQRWSHGARPAALALGLLVALPFVWQLTSVAEIVAEPGVPATSEAARVVAERLEDGDVLVSGSSLPHMGLMERAVAAAGPRVHMPGPSEGWLLPLERSLERDAVQRVWLFAFTELRFGRPKIDQERLIAWRERWLGERFEAVERWSFHRL